MTTKKPLRERVREAGGFYEWFNESLIRVAGPPQLGPGPGTPCARCGALKDEHTLDESFDPPLLVCPDQVEATAGADRSDNSR